MFVVTPGQPLPWSIAAVQSQRSLASPATPHPTHTHTSPVLAWAPARRSRLHPGLAVPASAAPAQPPALPARPLPPPQPQLPAARAPPPPPHSTPPSTARPRPWLLQRRQRGAPLAPRLCPHKRLPGLQQRQGPLPSASSLRRARGTAASLARAPQRLQDWGQPRAGLRLLRRRRHQQTGARHLHQQPAWRTRCRLPATCWPLLPAPAARWVGCRPTRGPRTPLLAGLPVRCVLAPPPCCALRSCA